MNEDQKLIAERLRVDERTFLVNALDPKKAPRLSLAANAMRGALQGSRWRSHAAVVAAGLRESDLAVSSVSNILYRAVKAGMVERRGEYVRKHGRTPAQDQREYRLVDWPCDLDEK